MMLLAPAVLFTNGCSDDSDTWAVPPTAWKPAVESPCTAPIVGPGIWDKNIVELVDLSGDNVLTYSTVHLHQTPQQTWSATCGPPLAAPLAPHVTITARTDSAMCGARTSPPECTVDAMKSTAAQWNSRAPIAAIQFEHQKIAAIEEQGTQ
ncbi:hypothetical protein ACFXHA_37865 [Nocardia sp. NPDC059240]|uniref:hypothetical protein n=1 Tax=Nocardia sp. NPDC059240 TaxID=3346786 RepID=UPI0036B0C010